MKLEATFKYFKLEIETSKERRYSQWDGTNIKHTIKMKLVPNNSNKKYRWILSQVEGKPVEMLEEMLTEILSKVTEEEMACYKRPDIVYKIAVNVGKDIIF